ncbi:hypothetical protein J2X84_004964 [Pseudomonas corrugata]|uniref:YopT-type cysteine protease domain-containing protein n=1 Tax=Pseudomonas corrugata TaxID=47879 RepID=UPI00286597C7|nr:YopT-type cysteine protease domain-containing protein [Pseudomonas corrugata]MDR7286101.1 hypothetical protein [Pseudomonas corrugata]
MEQALERKTNNSSISTKTKEKLVSVANTDLKLPRMIGEYIFHSRPMKADQVEAAYHTEIMNLKTSLTKSLIQVNDKNIKVKDAHTTWIKNCTEYFNHHTLNTKTATDTNYEKPPLTETSNNPKNTTKPIPEKVVKIFELLGAKFETLPKNYRDLCESMPSKEISSFIKNRCKNNKIDLNAPLRPRMIYKTIDAIQNTFPELHCNLAASHQGELRVDFNQSDFLGATTLGKKGVCYPMTLKWLADHEPGTPIDFFNDINTPEGREEIMSLVANPRSIGLYRKNRNLADEATRSKTFERIEGDGKFLIKMLGKDSSMKGHAMGAIAYHNNSLYLMFDPNRGVFAFKSEQQLNSFINDYSSVRYRDMQSPEVSFG